MKNITKQTNEDLNRALELQDKASSLISLCLKNLKKRELKSSLSYSQEIHLSRTSILELLKGKDIIAGDNILIKGYGLDSKFKYRGSY